MNEAEALIGIAGIATSLAGFTGVVVVFGSRRERNWHPGDRLWLRFLSEASANTPGTRRFARRSMSPCLVELSRILRRIAAAKVSCTQR